jgi:hypothetical protein
MQILDVVDKGDRLYLKPFDISKIENNWFSKDNCNTSYAVTNKVNDTLILCQSNLFERIYVRWGNEFAGANEFIISNTPFRAPHNTTIHEYTVKTMSPSQYYSVVSDSEQIEKMYIHITGVYSAVSSSQNKWLFRGTEIQFSKNGVSFDYAFRFRVERSGALSIDHRNGISIVALELEALNP